MDYLQDLKKGLYTDEEIQYKIKNNYRLALEELRYNEEDKSEVANIKNWLRYRILFQIYKGVKHDCDCCPIVHEMYNKIFETIGNEKGEGRYFQIDNVTLETDTMNSFSTTFNEFMRKKWYPSIHNGKKFKYGTNLNRDINFLKNIDKWYAQTEDKEVISLFNDFAKLTHSPANMILVPKGYNSERGTSRLTKDYWDLSLIDLKGIYSQNAYYDDSYRWFFENEFENKKGFMLDDWFDENGKVKLLFTGHSFKNPLPKNTSEFKECLQNIIKRIENRSKLLEEKPSEKN